jgi:hypothetical protein
VAEYTPIGKAIAQVNRMVTNDTSTVSSRRSPITCDTGRLNSNE